MAQKKAGVVNNTRREGFQSFPQGEQNNSVARQTPHTPQLLMLETRREREREHK